MTLLVYDRFFGRSQRNENNRGEGLEEEEISLLLNSKPSSFSNRHKKVSRGHYLFSSVLSEVRRVRKRNTDSVSSEFVALKEEVPELNKAVSMIRPSDL